VSDRVVFEINDEWALSADKLQWILQRRGKGMSFVSSTRDILARCMREKGVPSADATAALGRLPLTFAEWAAPRSKASRSDFVPPPLDRPRHAAKRDARRLRTAQEAHR
jgi:hypothetical protein